jgi:hypothetical protein
MIKVKKTVQGMLLVIVVIMSMVLIGCGEKYPEFKEAKLSSHLDAIINKYNNSVLKYEETRDNIYAEIAAFKKSYDDYSSGKYDFHILECVGKRHDEYLIIPKPEYSKISSAFQVKVWGANTPKPTWNADALIAKYTVKKISLFRIYGSTAEDVVSKAEDVVDRETLITEDYYGTNRSCELLEKKSGIEKIDELLIKVFVGMPARFGIKESKEEYNKKKNI